LSSDDWISVGRVGRSHGVRGAFVVENPSDSPERFAIGARVYVEREPATVLESKRAGGRPVVKLDRVAPRGATLEIPRAELPEPEEDSFYVFQLVGLAVEEETGRSVGRVKEVDPGIANDVLRLDTGVALPLVEECVRSVDLERRRIVIAPGFAEPG
jgi:16S rRNA processing protein RimM